MDNIFSLDACSGPMYGKCHIEFPFLNPSLMRTAPGQKWASRLEKANAIFGRFHSDTQSRRRDKNENGS